MPRAGTQRRAGLQRQLLDVAIDQPVREDVAFDERQPVDEAEMEREPLGRHVGGQIFGYGQRDRREETALDPRRRSEEHTSELQSLMRISYAVFGLKKKKQP